MADEPKAKSAKQRLEAAKQAAVDAAVDAEIVAEDATQDQPAPPRQDRGRSSEEAREHAVEVALNAAEKARTEAGDAKDSAVEAAEAAAQSAEVAKEAAAEATEASAPATETTAAPDAVMEGVADQSAPETTSGDAPNEDASPDKDPGEDNARAEPSSADKPAPAKPAAAGRSFAATALLWLAIAVVISAGALWAAPRIAPILPAWAAPVAAFLTPGADQAAARIAEVEAAAEARLAALAERIDAVEAQSGDDAALREAITALEARLESQISEIADAPRQDLSALEATIDTAAGRVSATEAALEGLRAEIEALSGITGENAAPSAETLERVAAFGAAVEGVRAELAALSAKVAVIDTLAAQQDVTVLTARVDALEGGEAATQSARDEAETIRRDANLDAALTRISQALASGAPFDAPLGQAVNLSGEPAPEPLEAVAASGAPTTDSLIRSFGPAAQSAYAAALSAEAGEGFGERLLARLEGRIGGRPAIETEGADAGAVLSRIEARLGEGRLDAARAEAAVLPGEAATAMSGWLAALAKADDARRGLADWRAALEAN